MKKIILFFVIIVGLWSTSCKKYLAVNNNPNSLTAASPDLVLPLAIVNTASLVSGLNDYGSQTVGYAANAGGYGGFGASWTYDYTNSTGDGYWSSAYATLENYKTILNSTQGSDQYAYYNAAAKIMSAYIYQMLVDEFNSIPYNESLKGDTILKPSYDDAATIYATLAASLDSAITEIDNAQAPTGLSAGTDPLFGGNMTNWKQFANTLKLRLIVRASGIAQFANTTFSADGFLKNDALVNPGYTLATATSGSQVNPSWGTWVATYAGSRVGQAWIPATYVFGYYDGTKLTDTFRGKIIYNGWNDAANPTPYNQLGIQPPNNTLSSPSNGGAWYSGGGSTGTSWGNSPGVMKGPNMGEPLMLLAESDFLQAEADVRGILSQNDSTDFYNGILASFKYLYEGPDDATYLAGNGPDNSSLAVPNPVTDALAYESQNSTSYLVNYSLAASTAQKTEAIITQKYIALNFINGQEAWSEYRRTGYPLNSPTVINNPYGSFTSTQSQATRPDGLPTRLPYPDTEVATNGTNVPQVSAYTSTIFWAH